MPAVSVITCTFNRAHLIGETIRSIQVQTMSDFEYIIIDDGSDDHTEEVVSSFQDPRIQYHRVDRTKGHLSKLRNFGVSKSMGQYIAFVDSDDLWEPDKLALQFSGLENDPTTGFSYTDVRFFDAQGTLKDKLYPQNGIEARNVFSDLLENRFPVCMTTLFFRRRCLDKIGLFNESFHSGDHDFIMRLALHFKCLVINDVKVQVRRHDQNTTRGYLPYLLEEHLTTIEDLFHEGAIDLKKRREVLVKLNYIFALQLLHGKRIADARHYLWRGIKINPMQVKSWIRLFLTVPQNILQYFGGYRPA